MKSITAHTTTYDNYGRMKYNPEFHDNHKKPWTNKDEKFLIENYSINGPDFISMALGRTLCTVMERARSLRKAGKMKPRQKGDKFHERTKAE